MHSAVVKIKFKGSNNSRNDNKKARRPPSIVPATTQFRSDFLHITALILNPHVYALRVDAWSHLTRAVTLWKRGGNMEVARDCNTTRASLSENTGLNRCCETGVITLTPGWGAEQVGLLPRYLNLYLHCNRIYKITVLVNICLHILIKNIIIISMIMTIIFYRCICQYREERNSGIL